MKKIYNILFTLIAVLSFPQTSNLSEQIITSPAPGRTQLAKHLMVIAAQRTSQVTSPTHTQRFQIKHTKKKQKNNKNHQHPQNQFNKILYMNPTKPGIEICRALHREQSHDCSVLLRASSRDSRMVSITRGK